MSTPAMTKPNKRFLIRASNIPESIRNLDDWLMWRYEENPRPGKKPLKVPYWINGKKRYGELGGSKDRRNLASFDTALETANSMGFDGVGLAIMPEHDLTVLDIDDCIDDNGEFSEFANEVINSGTYVERSPSGRGLRAVYTGAIVPGEKRNFRIENGERVEVYCGAAYTTFTGNKESGVPREISKLPADIKRTLVRGIKASGQSTEATAASSGDAEGLASMNAIAIPNMTPAQALRVLKGLPKHWGTSGDGTWFQVAAALHMQFDGSEEGYEVLDAWSKDRDGYDEEGNRRRWEAGFSHDRGKQNVRSMRNLVFEAKQAGAKFKQATLESWGLVREAQEKAAESEIELPDEDGSQAEAIRQAWQPVDISGWNTEERPEGARALIKNWIYEGTVVLFSSHGGGGKSYVTLTLAALAADPAGGRQWFGTPIERGDVLIVNGEDPVNEIRHRLWGICSAYGLDLGGLAGHLDLVDVTGLLHKALYTAGTDYGKTEFTDQYERLKDLIESKQYKYLIIDNLAKFYMANENARPMVDEFVSALAALAADRGIGVVLVGHASKLGSDGYSGSTAWHNSARARWLLNITEGNRDLMVEKNNYGATNHGGRFVWDDDKHVIYMQAAIGDGSAENEFSDLGLEEAVLGAVREIYEGGGHVPTSEKGKLGPIGNHPNVLESIGDDHKALRKALKSLCDRGLLVRGTYKKSNRTEAEEYLPREFADPING